jgi:hypothetical protein
VVAVSASCRKVMNAQSRLLLGSVLLAIAWTVAMIWWSDTETSNVVITSIAGAVLGVLWYFGMRAFLRWQGRNPAK